MNELDNPTKRLLRQVFTHSSVNKRCIKEVAPLVGLTERALYQYAEPDKTNNMSADAFAIISRYEALEYCDTRLAEHCLPEGSVIILPQQSVRCSGEISEALTEAIVTLGEIARAWRERDDQLADSLASRLANVAGRIKAEAAAKTQMRTR